MNQIFATKSTFKRRPLKVHKMNADGRPRCGGGNGGKQVAAWQQDVGPANCQRCEQLSKPKQAKDV